ncbi:MAG: nickel pincer cofactor biosynthesis protein LarB [Lawsonibacter sp.]|jgi:NCAIR mutase (PurE)-related protein|nr:nickel pincer cofactor biosynthesis protein LarB [Lawsonibacter sp.]MCI9654572.1 nickel pincer cofactor biosynthesis protein LarB [Lawsonibacter sp.]MDE6898569.1 nickel pincer cofactor biosynthesis protein LarB [Lawsonibacter sp.]
MDNRYDILQLLRRVADGSATPEEALSQLKRAPFEDLGYAKVDLHRGVRQGAAEVIYGAGKTPEQIAGIAAAMGERGCQNILITRLSPESAKLVAETIPLDYHPVPRVAIAYPGERRELGHIVVATGGTSDLPVAEEAALTAQVLGNRVTRLYDVGVAGLHRLLANLEPLMSARCIVAVAGMEGALASVIGGLVDCPVIAVPTSVGYGASFGGLSALLAMLNSCASGCSVVNIDNGFGAGYLASMINQMEGLE